VASARTAMDHARFKLAVPDEPELLNRLITAAVASSRRSRSRSVPTGSGSPGRETRTAGLSATLGHATDGRTR
jgi:hypothetical protein